MQRTRMVRVDPEHRRQDALNGRTVVAEVRVARAWQGFEEAFCCCWHAIRPTLQAFRQPGVAVVALHRDRGTVSTVCLGARPDRINATVMGRHAEADLFVTDDPAVSLRHLVVLTHPLSAGAFRASVLDLRTPDAFWDEQRRRCEALTFDGAVFLGCGAYALYLFPTARDRAWPLAAEKAWGEFPPRVYTPIEQVAWPEQPPEPPAAPRNITRVSVARGPVTLRRELVGGEERPVGELRITTQTGAGVIALGRRALQQGVLLGRYERCDTV